MCIRDRVRHEEAKSDGMEKKAKVEEKTSKMAAQSQRSERSSRSNSRSSNSSSSSSSNNSNSRSNNSSNGSDDDASLGTCEPHEKNTEYWGAVVLNGDNHKTKDAGECCDACRNLNRADGNRCNVWVFNPTTKACWLKFEKNIKEMKPANSGPHVPWVAGKFTNLTPPKPPQHPPATGKSMKISRDVYMAS